MNDITIEEIKRLEQVGLAIADSIVADYESCKNAANAQNTRVHELYKTFSETIESLDKEDTPWKRK